MYYNDSKQITYNAHLHLEFIKLELNLHVTIFILFSLSKSAGEVTYRMEHASNKEPKQ